jgi:uncharacterized protein
MLLSKILFPVTLFVSLSLHSQKIKDTIIPKPIGHVNDFEKIYSPDEIKTLDSTIIEFEKRTTIQIAIITIDTLMVDRRNFDSWTLKVMNTWGVGQKEKNNGILIGISKGYRRIRIQNGAGIVKILSNQETKEIIDKSFLPFFKDGKYFEGTVNGLQALINKLE